MKFVFLFLILTITKDGYAYNDYSYKHCEDNETRLTSLNTENKECMPDTLYHWLPEKYLTWKIQNQSAKHFFPIPRQDNNVISLNKGKILPVFTWRTPIGSHGYGDVAIRIKLKEKIKYVLVDNKYKFQCHELGQISPISKTVFINTMQVYRESINGTNAFLSEYIICSDQVIDSWSYGTKTHYQEMQNEYDWINSHSPEEYDSFISKLSIWYYPPIDKKDFSEREYLRKQKLHFNQVGLFCLKKNDQYCRQNHFETRIPYYATEKVSIEN